MRNRILLLLVLVGLLPSLACAQIAITGKITGVVTDASGAAVPNATVTVKSTSLMSVRTTNSGADGSYLFDLLPPGAYEVNVTAKGFRTVSETGVVITAGFTATVNAKLQVGEVTQTVQVEGEPVVDLQNNQTEPPLIRRCCRIFQAGATRGPRLLRCPESPPAPSMSPATTATSSLPCRFMEALRPSKSIASMGWT